MTDSKEQEAIMEVLIERFKTQRLPRIERIKEYVDQGQPLSEYDRLFLEEVFRDAHENFHLVENIPECRHLFARMVSLYKDIVQRALENERNL